MDEMNENLEIEYSDKDMHMFFKIIKEEYPYFFEEIDKRIKKPTLTDFNEIPDVIHFVEVNEDIMDSFLFMPFKEKMEFMRLAIAVIILLYDPLYFDKFKYEKQPNLLYGLRAAMAEAFGYKKSHSTVSEHFKTIRENFDVYPFFKKRAYKLADEYRKEITNPE